MARKRRTYSAEFRAEAVRLVLEAGLKHVRVARDLGIPESSVSRWVRQARIDAGQGQAGVYWFSVNRTFGRRLKGKVLVLMLADVARGVFVGALWRPPAWHRAA